MWTAWSFENGKVPPRGGFPVAEQAFADADVNLITLTNYEAVVAEALRTGYIADDQVPMLHEWRKDPAHWNA